MPEEVNAEGVRHLLWALKMITMKRFSFLFVALVTLAAGVTLTRYSSSLFQPDEVSLERHLSSSQRSQSTDCVQISLRRSFRDKNGVVNAQFKVVNNGAEPLIYRGYSKGDHEQWTVKRGYRSKRYSPFCGSGLEDRVFEPNESMNLTVPLGHKGGNYEVGFDFLVGAARAVSKQSGALSFSSLIDDNV